MDADSAAQKVRFLGALYRSLFGGAFLKPKVFYFLPCLICNDAVGIQRKDAKAQRRKVKNTKMASWPTLAFWWLGFSGSKSSLRLGVFAVLSHDFAPF
jgi:hypothetical protein